MANGLRLPTMHELIEEHSALLYRYAYRLTGDAYDAEDLVQQTFLLAHQHRDQLRDAQAARGWLISIVRNVFLKSIRHRGRGRSLEEIDEPSMLEASLDEPIHLEVLQQALLELSEEFRSPLVLYYFEEFSYQEIAKQMGVPIGTVMSRLSRAKAYLKKRLTESADREHQTAAGPHRTREFVLQHQ
ncbi:MAG: sigma-70 family RNA polymerase sigma factor [Rhizobium sp.]|nr:MAG: sigma-70 family RNA polymerase sigma factor [Rhizobium sp.]